MISRAFPLAAALFLLSACASAPGGGQVPWADAKIAEISEQANAGGFRGEIAFSLGKDAIYHASTDGIEAEQAWPWASVTKQIVATLVVQQAERGTFALDDPVASYLPKLVGSEITWRELLQHRTPLPNPDETATTDGWPEFYTDDQAQTFDWCARDLGNRPESGYRYNNCDYIVLGAALEKATGATLNDLFAERIAEPAKIVDTGFMAEGEEREFAVPEPLYRIILPRFGAAGGMVGPLSDMIRFDRALLEERLLPEDALQTMWTGDPALGYMALGQWAFDAPLEGCIGDVRIIERRGAIGKYQLRNIILPDRGIILAMATDQGEDTFSFGEVWSGSGFTFDILSTAACQ